MAAIQTENLTKRFGRDVYAVDDLDLRVAEGEIFGFLGPNGAGKSTTINALLDYVRPTSGRASVLGYDAQRETTAIRERVGVLPEGYDLYERLTGRRHLEFAIELKGSDEDPDALLERVGLSRTAGDRKAGEYSRGMAQRLALGMALVGDPDLLILDEPTNGLDPNGAREMREIVREHAADGGTVFFSSHVLGQVQAVCDRVAILEGGQLVAVDSIAGLRSEVGSGSSITIEAEGLPENLPLESISGVSEVQHRNGHVTVGCTDGAAKLAALDAVRDAGATVTDFSTSEASLEDLFAAYTTEGEQ